MRNLKKIISLVLALMMVLSMMVTASAAFADQDKIDAKYAEAIEVMAELGILQGDGTNFNPLGTLTRAEAAVILSKVISGKTEVEFFENQTLYVENPFEDVSGWAQPYVLYCLKNGVVQGRNATTYDPKGTLTGYEFAKMMLVASGVRTQFTTENWKSEVVAAAEKTLLNGLVISLNNPITREQASHMALNAMKVGMTSASTYDVYVGEQKVASYDEILDAYLTAQILGGDVVISSTSTGGILADTFKVIYTKNGLDNYGRAATTYTFPATKTAPAYKLAFNTPATLNVYNNTVSAAQAEKDLKGYTVAADVWVDGVYTTTADTTAAIAALTGPNAVVELYANTDKVITKAVVVNTEVAEVVITKATKTEPEYVTIGGIKVPNTYGLVKGDVVAYTQYNGTLDTVTKLEGTEAALSGLNSYGYYTINGVYYTLDLPGTLDANTIKNTLKDGSKLVYYFGANNTVVYFQVPGVETPDTPAVVYNNFAVVLNTAAKITETTTTDLWGKPSTTYTAEAAAKLLLADGKEVTVSVAIAKADKDIKVAGVKVVAKGEYYYTVGNQYVVIEKTATTLAALDNKVVAYDDGVINFAPTFADLDAKTSGNVYAIVGDTVVNNVTPAVDGIIVNSNTVFVVSNAKGDGYTTVKGQAALGKTGVTAEIVIYEAKWIPSADGKSGTYAKTALVVFSGDKVVSDTPVVTPVDYVMYTGYTTTSWDAKNQVWVNEHSMMKADGTYVTVKLPESVTLYNVVIYVLNSDGTLDTLEDGSLFYYGTNGEIKTVSENFIEVTGDYTGDADGWIMTNAKTAVYGELVAGNYAFYADANGDGYVDVLFAFAQ